MLSDVKTDALLKIRKITADYFKNTKSTPDSREIGRVLLEIEMVATEALIIETEKQ